MLKICRPEYAHRSTIQATLQQVSRKVLATYGNLPLW